MATITTLDTRLHTLPPATGRAGLRGTLASEFTKLRSVRSTYWALAALLIVSIGVGALVMGGESGSLIHNPGNRAGFDGTQVSLIPFFEIGQLIIGVLGALTITSEYSTGMIRTSLTAMPRRGVVYAAKAIVFTGVTLVFALITSFAAFFVGQAMVASTKEGAALFVTLVALIAFGLGAIIRHTAGAIATVIGLMFIIPVIIQALPDNWRQDIMRFFPDAAGRVISVTVPGGGSQHLWSSWPQMLVTACYAVTSI